MSAYRKDKCKYYVNDIQEIMEVSKVKAIQVVKDLGGEKDSLNRWWIAGRKFFRWYNGPLQKAGITGGGFPVEIEDLMQKISDFAGKEKVDFFVEKRPDRKNWSLRIYSSSRRGTIVSLKTPQKKVAKAIEAELRSRFNQQAVDGITPYSTENFFWEWLALKEKILRKSSYNKYRSVVDKAIPFMCSNVHKVTEQDMERYLDWLISNDYAPKTIREEFGVLRQLFKKAIRLGYAKINPAEGMDLPEVGESQVLRYSDEELKLIFAEIHRKTKEGRRIDSRKAWKVYKEIFYCLLYTGVRISDAVGTIRWKDVKNRFSKIDFMQQKTGRHVIITIPEAYKERLMKLAEGKDITGKDANELVYLNTCGNPVTYTRMDHAIRSVLKAVGIEKKSPLHAFRHTVAMRLLEAGVPVNQVAAQLGDTVETIVRTYVKEMPPSQEDIDRAYEVDVDDSKDKKKKDD